MNCPKTNTYPKHYAIGKGYIISIVSPKPWHSVFMTEVDTLILTTYNKVNEVIICQSLPL